jgi:hypothetical protein
VISLGISPRYVSHWTTADAFQELYQNWYVSIVSSDHEAKSENRKDAILERFQVHRMAFRPYFVDIEARRSLGFIKYDKKSSRVTLANACMQLPAEALELSFSTKGGQEQLAGSHGDGLKLAAVVLSRDGYRLQVVASRCSWCFQLREPCKFRLHCIITPSRQSGSIQTDWAEDIAGLRFQTERDVAMFIGPGRANQGRPVAT